MTRIGLVFKQSFRPERGREHLLDERLGLDSGKSNFHGLRPLDGGWLRLCREDVLDDPPLGTLIHQCRHSLRQLLSLLL